jgi:hypothetical protein
MRHEFPMYRPLGRVVAALVLFGAVAGILTLAWLRGLTGSLSAVGAVLSAVMAACAGLAVRNLRGHEGWAVVLAEDALEIPGAPFRSRRRDRIPYTAIFALALAPPPPAAPEIVIVEASSEPGARWIRQEDLVEGELRDLYRALEERVRRRRGPGRPFRTISG